MKIGSKEHYEILADFEKCFKGHRFDKESKELWSIKYVYQDGEVNKLYNAFILGYAAGKCAERMEGAA